MTMYVHAMLIELTIQKGNKRYFAFGKILGKRLILRNLKIQMYVTISILVSET